MENGERLLCILGRILRLFYILYLHRENLTFLGKNRDIFSLQFSCRRVCSFKIWFLLMFLDQYTFSIILSEMFFQIVHIYRDRSNYPALFDFKSNPWNYLQSITHMFTLKQEHKPDVTLELASLWNNYANSFIRNRIVIAKDVWLPHPPVSYRDFNLRKVCRSCYLIFGENNDMKVVIIHITF